MAIVLPGKVLMSPKALFLHLYVLLIFINDLPDGLNSNVKIFADYNFQ